MDVLAALVVMLALATRSRSWPNRGMSTLKEKEALARRRMGLALSAVRRRLGLSQDQASEAVGWKSAQAWQYYEHGKRHFSDPKLDQMLAALGASREEFDQQLALIPDEADALPARRGMREPAGRGFSLPVGGIAHGGARRPNLYDDQSAEIIDFGRFFAPGTRVLRLDGMSMFPYAEPGGFVTYNVKQPPRRGYGCVIEMADGSYSVKRFERYEGDALIVSELHPVERLLDPIPLADIKGVYAIGLRGD